jgi:hypothetical protein
MKNTTVQTLLRAASGLMALWAGAAWGAYSCNVTTTSVGVIYTGGNVDTNGLVTLTCTRDSGDANTLTYRIKATDGNNSIGTDPFRRARLGVTANYLRYILRRGTTVGGAASCGNTSTWRAPATGTTNVITGTLSFGAALTQSATWGYCIRVRGTAGGNPAMPTAGVYTDAFNVFAQYPSTDGSPLTPVVAASYTVGVGSQCVFNTFPTSMAFSYTSFSVAPQVVTRQFDLRCSNTLPWSIAISLASNTLLGLNYTLAPSPASGTGTGNDQIVTLTGTLGAGQAGTCATATCTATQPHVVTITY